MAFFLLKPLAESNHKRPKPIKPEIRLANRKYYPHCLATVIDLPSAGCLMDPGVA